MTDIREGVYLDLDNINEENRDVEAIDTNTSLINTSLNLAIN